MVPTTYAQEGFRAVSAADIVSHPPEKRPLDRTRSDYQITERGAHHQVWERVETVTDLNGQEEEVVRSYTELGANLNYWDSQASAWKETRELIEPIAGGAIARQGGQQVKFASDLNVEGSVEILNSDGVRLRSTVVGIVFRDSSLGLEVEIARVKTSRGQILQPNRILYRDAFEGIEADVLYIYRRSGVVQDVILREDPPNPEDLGFPSHSSPTLEIVTEFFDSPEPLQSAEPSASTVGSEEFSFGAMLLVDGVAFPVENGEERADVLIGVSKEWKQENDRQFLHEGVQYNQVSPFLTVLGKRTRPERTRVANLASAEFSELNLAVELEDSSPMLVGTQDQLSRSGFLVDYTTVSGLHTNFVFKSGQTYHINGGNIFYGTTVFEGGAVIKHGASVQTYMNHQGVDFRTTEFSPVIITSRHDDSVGQTISSSTGTPPASPYEHNNGITIGAVPNQVIKNLTVRYCRNGIWINGSQGAGGHRIQNVRISDCSLALVSFGARNVQVENGLIRNTHSGFYTRTFPGQSIDAQVIGTNVTMHDVQYPINQLSGGDPDELKNSLLVGGNSASYTGQAESHNVELSSSSGVFQTVGGGNSYLATNSPYRDIGTDQVDPQLKYRLKSMTTFPPEVHDGPLTYASNLQWNPHVPRDNDGNLDVGYHYPAIDYLVNNVKIDGTAILTVAAGTHIGLYGSSAFKLGDDAIAHFNGTVEAPIQIGWYGDLQDGTDSSRVNTNSHYLFNPRDDIAGANLNELHLSFTYFYRGSMNTGEQYGLWLTDGGTHGCSQLTVRHCRFDGLTFMAEDLSGRNHEWLNNLFKGGKVWFEGAQAVDFRNNWLGGTHTKFIQTVSPDLWVIQDNLFDAPDASSTSTLTSSTLGYNGYVNTSYRVGGSTLGSDVTPSSVSYVTGPFGDHYHNEASLQNAGSRTAAAAGMFHYSSTWPNDIKEGGSTVDIGLHYPSTIPGSGGN